MIKEIKISQLQFSQMIKRIKLKITKVLKGEESKPMRVISHQARQRTLKTSSQRNGSWRLKELHRMIWREMTSTKCLMASKLTMKTMTK